MGIQKPSSNHSLEPAFQTLKKSRTFLAIGSDVLDAKKERSITFNARTGSYLSPIEAGAKDMAM